MKIDNTTSDFRRLIEYSYLYIDKTQYLLKLINFAQVVFLARPRRFGKSLLLSTLTSYFEGEKQLFHGLAIEREEHDWQKYPVINLSLSDFIPGKAPRENLNIFLHDKLNLLKMQFGLTLTNSSVEGCFTELIQLLSKRHERTVIDAQSGDQQTIPGKVVVLIDEYDAPAIMCLDEQERDAVIDTLRGFYGVIKNCSKYIRFAMITGVTKLALSTFHSAFNNPRDISMISDFAEMLGFTQNELEHYFGDEIDKAAEANGMSPDAVKAKIKVWYNGYKFHKDAKTVYNPVSIGYFFSNNYEFDNYWIDTGTPTILINEMRKRKIDILTLKDKPVARESFKAFDISQIDIIGLLFQSGYLTIKGYADNRFRLDFPNYEVEHTFSTSLLQISSDIAVGRISSILLNLLSALDNADFDTMKETWDTFFVNISYQLRDQVEFAFQTVFAAFYLLVTCDRIQTEEPTGRGRIDCILETKDKIYIHEFKVNGRHKAGMGMQQIRDREYAAKYLASGKSIYAVSIDFSKKDGNIRSWKWEQIA